MTVMVRRASKEDILMMDHFLERAREAFDGLPVGALAAVVDAVFLEFAGHARDDFPVAIVWLRVGTDDVCRQCRFLRWIQRELMLLREGAIRRCAGIAFTTI